MKTANMSREEFLAYRNRVARRAAAWEKVTKMTKSELLEIAEKKGVQVTAKFKKDEILAALKTAKW